MPSLMLQAILAGEQAMRRRVVGPPQNLAGRLRSAIENGDSLDMLLVKRVAAMLSARGHSYGQVGRAARAATASVRAKEHGHTVMAARLRDAAVGMLVGA